MVWNSPRFYSGPGDVCRLLDVYLKCFCSLDIGSSSAFGVLDNNGAVYVYLLTYYWMLVVCEWQSSGVHGRRTDITRRTSSQPSWWWDAATRARAQHEAAAGSASDGEEQRCRSVVIFTIHQYLPRTGSGTVMHPDLFVDSIPAVINTHFANLLWIRVLVGLRNVWYFIAVFYLGFHLKLPLHL